MKKAHFFGLLLLYVVSSFYLALTTPITPHEANNLYANSNIVSLLMQWGESIISGFLGLRIFFLLFAFLSLYIFYKLNQQYFKKKEDAYLSTALFMFLPGIMTATVLANIGIIVLTLVLFFVLLYEQKHFVALPPIMLSLFFIHEASIVFFIALLFYAVEYKNKFLFIFSSAFILAFLYLTKGIDIGGHPFGHFLEIFGLYATVFSPLLFLYFFYTMYYIFLCEEKTLMWYISFVALTASLLLSLRQKVYITDFAPYVMISTIAMVDIFRKSLYIRLPQFQKYYLKFFYVVITILAISAGIIIFNKPLYYLLKQTEKHFALHVYRPYELAKELKEKHISCYNAKGRTILQLRYYGIPSCRDN
ncbi:MAG: hypothetical protein LGB03_01605 [Sulfurovum sp.]|nr:hypothetical protein [Sulfurovum sp.]